MRLHVVNHPLVSHKLTVLRDERYKGRTEANGKPIYCSRGNGWVLAGLARWLESVPADFANQPARRIGDRLHRHARHHFGHGGIGQQYALVAGLDQDAADFVIAGVAHGASPLSSSEPQREAMACASSCGSPATMPAATTAVAAAGS